MTDNAMNVPEMVITNDVVEQVIQGVIGVNGPGTEFMLVVVKAGTCPAIVSSMIPEQMDHVLDWLVEHRARRRFDVVDLESPGEKKGH